MHDTNYELPSNLHLGLPRDIPLHLSGKTLKAFLLSPNLDTVLSPQSSRFNH